MNWNKKQSADPQTAERGRIDFTKLAEDIAREDTPRVSEYAPKLRDRMEAATQLTMQERAKATKAMIDEAIGGMERINEMAQQAQQKCDRLVSLIQQATTESNEEQQRTLQAILGFCDVLDQVKEPAALRLPKNAKPKTLPTPAPENEDATK